MAGFQNFGQPVTTIGQLRKVIDGMDDNDKLRVGVFIDEIYHEGEIAGIAVEADRDTIIFKVEKD